jgi:microcystin-dependent protein
VANQITKILIRSGTDVQRRTVNGAGIVFSLAEPAFCTDTLRLYVGDGQTPGALPAGMRNLGIVPVLFGSSINGFSPQAVATLTLSGAEVGDVIFDLSTGSLYSLSSKSAFPPLSSDLVKYSTSVALDPALLQFNTNNQITIIANAIGPNQINSTLAGTGLQKPLAASPISLANATANSFLGNGTNTTAIPASIAVQANQFVGRTATSVLTALNFSLLLQGAGINGTNGISFNSTTGSFSLSSSLFTITPTQVNVLVALSASTLAGDGTNIYNVIPPGGLLPYAGSSAPTGWLLCNGAAISRSTYANLFAAIGTAYGFGDGVTTFNIPDLRGLTLVGAGSGSGLTQRNLGQVGGEENHQLSVNELAAHTHPPGGGTNFVTSPGTADYLQALPGFNPVNFNTTQTGSTGGNAAHNNMQPFGVANYIIKF